LSGRCRSNRNQIQHRGWPCSDDLPSSWPTRVRPPFRRSASSLVRCSTECQSSCTIPLPLQRPRITISARPNSRGHLEVWEASRATLSLHDEYDDYPRGRIVYDTRHSHFIAYLDRSLDVPEFRRAVLHYFALPERGTVFRHDAHYGRARHRMTFNQG